MRKKRKAAMAVISVLAVTLGQRGYAADNGESPSEKADASALSGELVISSAYVANEFGYWEMIAEAFMKEYPEVSVRIEAPSKEEMSTEAGATAYFQRFRTQVMNGECGDIIGTSYFDMEKYGVQQGLFEDLYPYIDSDPDFHREDYFPCLFKGTGEKLYEFTPYVQPVYVKLNKNILNEAGIQYTDDTISFWDLADIDEQVRAVSGDSFYLMDYGSYDPLGEYENGYYIRNGSFDTEEYRRYLEANHKMKYTSKWRPFWNMIDNTIDSDVICRRLCFSPQYSQILDSMFEETEEVTAAILYEGIHGEKYSEASYPASISSFSENKELAWEFMKFLVGDHGFSWSDYTGISVNREKAERVLQESGTREEVTGRLLQDMEQINEIPFFDAALELSMQPVFEDYYLNDIISAEECAKQLSDKVYLYQNE